jgi:hypothetical protein
VSPIEVLFFDAWAATELDGFEWHSSPDTFTHTTGPTSANSNSPDGASPDSRADG